VEELVEVVEAVTDTCCRRTGGSLANSVAKKTTTASPCRATIRCILSLGFPCPLLLGPALL
jgi:hypothetical protein